MKKQTMLILTDAKNNNNKFYEVILNDDDSIKTRYGRVGAAGVSGSSFGGLYEYESIIRAKKRKGYVETQTLQTTVDSYSMDKDKLAETAKRDILNNNTSDVLIKLVDRLTKMNRHQIIEQSNGNIQIDDDGLIKTPLGLVTHDTVKNARNLLNQMSPFIDKKSFEDDSYIHNLEEYLKLIPQKVPSKRGWYNIFFTTHSSVNAQYSFLDQLDGSLDLYNDKKNEASKTKKTTNATILDSAPVFNTKLELLNDEQVFQDIKRFYEKTLSRNHVSSHLRLKNVYVISNDEWSKRFLEKSNTISNHQRLWHGSRLFNILSILKSGLIIPKSTGTYQVNGRMFGDGLYFSDQSSKSLNYSYGYWDGHARDNNCFMFLADVALGKQYIPKRSEYHIPKGYDSMFAKAGVSGVLNNEMIVYDINQANLKFLCEFDSV